MPECLSEKEETGNPQVQPPAADMNGMSEAINAALSALRATLRKQDVTANNIAKINTHDFKKSKAAFEETSPAGVKVTISRPETTAAPLPDDEVIGEGHEMSNVSPEEELVDLITTRHSFTANIKTLQTEDEMQGTLLDIIA